MPNAQEVLEWMDWKEREKKLKANMTNEEWLHTLNTEQLAEFIRKQRDDWSDGWYSDCHRFEEIVEWLKQPHNGE